MRGSRHWHCDLARLRLDMTQQAVRQAWQVAHRLLQQNGRSHGLHRIGGVAIKRLSETTRACESAAARDAVRALVGLGEGATPAGDDFLVGYLAGARSAARDIAPRTRFLAALCDQLTALLERTTRVSGLYLAAAAAGQISQRLYDVAAGIAAGAAAETIAVAVGAALDVGHSSGSCGVLGLLRGSLAWDAATPQPARIG